MSYSGENNNRGPRNNRQPERGNRSNDRNNRVTQSYGIFDETSFVKQKIPMEGFPKQETHFQKRDAHPHAHPNEAYNREQTREGRPRENYESRPRENYESRPRENYESRPREHYESRPRENYESRPRENYENRGGYNKFVPQAPARPNTPPSTSPKNFFVFDIETVPCIETARTFLDLTPEASDDEVVAKLTEYHSGITNGQNDFFRQLFHKIICVSFIIGTIQVIHGGKEKYLIKSIKTGGRNGETEEEILRELFSYLNKHHSRLISFNGRGFDLPVLQYRAMKYGIDAKWIYSDGYYNYNHRYSIEKHCDLLDMFSNFGASARVKMAEVASLFKIPCKIGGVSGADVYPMWKDGKIEDICNYCENDVLATYIMYLRFMQHSGKLSTEGYNIVIDALVEKLRAEDAPPHHTLFAEQFANLNLGDVHIKQVVNVPESQSKASSEAEEDSAAKGGIEPAEVIQEESVNGNMSETSENLAEEESESFEEDGNS